MIRALLSARWLPYAAISVAALVGGASLWSYGKGFAAAERTYLTAMNDALEEQAKNLRAQTALAVEKERRKYNVQKRVSSVRRVECQLTPECVQWMENVLRAAHDDSQ